MSISETGYNKHIQESMKLTAEGYRDLFAITMTPPGEAVVLITITPQKAVTWQGKTWEDWPCTLQGYSQDSSGQANRPNFSVSNPSGLFSSYAHKGWLDNAEVVRYRVLRSDLEGNVNSFLKNTWRVGKILALSPSVISMELRGALDWHTIIMPPRAYFPPEFQMVSL